MMTVEKKREDEVANGEGCEGGRCNDDLAGIHAELRPSMPSNPLVRVTLRPRFRCALRALTFAPFERLIRQ